MSVDNVTLNKQRVALQLKKVISTIRPRQQEILNNSVIYKNNRKVSLNEINFNESLVFVTPVDLLGVIGTYGLCKVNNVLPQDNTAIAKNSTIRTDYMIVNSPDVYLCKVLDPTTEGAEEYEYISYARKDIILWRLFADAGIGDNNRMFRIVNSLKDERECSKQLNWFFFAGKMEDLPTDYDIQDFPIYEVVPRSISVTRNSGKEML